MADQTFAVHCGFFDAIDSDRTYSADEMNRPYRRIISNGVFATPQGNPSTDLQVVESTGMNIICRQGEGLFADKWFENPSSIVITVPNNTSTVPRIDSVLVQVDTRTSGRVGNIVYRTGTPASSPVPPAINQTEGVVEYRLANIRVNAGVTSIMGRYITDRRGSTDCPWVTSLIYQVDTSTLYDQWQAAYAEYFEEEKAIWDAWYAQLTEDLDVSMTLDRHVNTVTTTPQTTGYIPIGLAYNHNTDILEVYINGLRAVEGTHYVVVDDTKILVENQLQIGQEVTFVVMRSVISGSATNITVLLQELESQIAGIAGGTPIVVDSTSDMTDTEKIYILSSDSKWYYYSATAEDWVIGGTYGGVPTDPTLTQEGMAADAKAVGDALADKADSSDVTALGTRVTAVEGDVSDLEEGLNEITEGSDNLFRFLNTTKTVNDVTITTDADNNVTFDGTASSNGGRLNKFTDIFTLPAGTYTIGQIVTDEASKSSLTRCAVVVQSNTSGTNVVATVASPNVPVTFTLDSETELYIGFNTSNAFVYNNVKFAVMLNVGSTLKEYESPQYVSAVDRQYRATESAEIVPYTRDDFVYGRISSSGDYQLAWIYALLDKFVPTEYISAVVGDSFKILVARYQNGVFVDIHDGAWKTGTYAFDHKTYQYKIIIAFSDDRRIGDLQDVADGLAFVQNTYAVTSNEYARNNSIAENSRVDSFNYRRLETLMRNNYDVSFANARKALYWKNPYGNSQNMHPKVLYISGGVGGHNYWMAYTPYDFGNVKHENPCIAYSDDGYNWKDISANPLADTDGEADTIYYSDTHLVYTGSRLECWYRKANGNTETIYRRNSPNGINWTDPEEIYSVTINGNALLSPAIIYDNPTHKYKIWVVNSANGYHIDYYEASSESITTWTLVRSINLTYSYGAASYNVWHIDVSYIDSKYVLIAMCKGTPWCVFMATSDDNVTYSTPTILLYPNSSDDWDAEMYRSCIIKTDADYRVYYSARWRLIYGTGVTTSDSLDKFIGTV